MAGYDFVVRVARSRSTRNSHRVSHFWKLPLLFRLAKSRCAVNFLTPQGRASFKLVICKIRLRHVVINDVDLEKMGGQYNSIKYNSEINIPRSMNRLEKKIIIKIIKLNLMIMC